MKIYIDVDDPEYGITDIDEISPGYLDWFRENIKKFYDHPPFSINSNEDLVVNLMSLIMGSSIKVLIVLYGCQGRKINLYELTKLTKLTYPTIMSSVGLLKELKIVSIEKDITTNRKSLIIKPIAELVGHSRKIRWQLDNWNGRYRKEVEENYQESFRKEACKRAELDSYYNKKISKIKKPIKINIKKRLEKLRKEKSLIEKQMKKLKKEKKK